MKKCFVVLLALVITAGCALNFEKRDNAQANSAANATASDNKNNQAAAENKNQEFARQSINPRAGQAIESQIKADCLKNRLGAKVPDAKQTFALDFEPFRDACFIVFHDAEFTNPPLNSEFYVYRDGKQIFEFPNQFNGVTVGCWVEGVSFVDLNGDDLKDVIVAGMCSAKAAPYSENMVYVNTGSAFVTDQDANYQLADFKKIKDIENFVRRNKQIFFK